MKIFEAGGVERLLRNHWGKLLWLEAVALLAFFGTGYVLALFLVPAQDSEGNPSQQTVTPATNTAEAPQIWTCSMHPQIRGNGPGKCPLCGMDLVPVTSTGGGLRSLVLSPAARALLQIETAPVERKYVAHEVEMVGKVDYDETRLGHITAWIDGRLDRLFVNYTGVSVRKGDHMVYMYSEELYAAQEELIQAVRFARERRAPQAAGGIDLAESAREKLRNWGLTDQQIKETETRGTPSYHMTIYSPVDGVVIDKLRQEGDRVHVGERIYTVADLRQLWVHLDAYESDLEWLTYGQQVTFTAEAYPGERFRGRIAFIQPVLDDQTRTVKVRVNVPNPDGKLKPGMFVRGKVLAEVASGGRVMDPGLAGKWISPMHPEIIKDHPGTCDICGMPLVRAETLGYVSAEIDDQAKPLVIPASAALWTGTRAIVYVDVPKAKEPTFEGREIVLGPRAGDYYIVLSGLAAGEMVVTQGNFKIDSEIQIQAKPSMMTPEGGAGGGMHHHGGSKAGAGEHAGHSPELPTVFRERLLKLAGVGGAVSDALKQGDLARVRRAFGDLGKTLNKVEGGGLAESHLAQWNDLAMLLNNDVVEGRKVQQLKDAQRAYEALAQHIQRMRRHFGLGDESSEHQPIVVTAEFQNDIGKIWRAYLPIQQALADDDLAGARNGLSELKTALATINAQSLSESARTYWKKERDNLASIQENLTQAGDIEKFRVAFALLSDEMKALIVSFGMRNVGPQYELHCPMAFEGRGAFWYQDNDQTRNPYYGKSMLKCADKVEQIEPPAPVENKAE